MHLSSFSNNLDRLSTRNALQPVKNYLFIVPDDLSHYERAVLKATTIRMTEFGYVYVADVRQREIEDLDHVRYLGMANRMLPQFGALEAVIIFHDESLVAEARRTYPDTRLYVLNTREVLDFRPSPISELLLG